MVVPPSIDGPIPVSAVVGQPSAFTPSPSAFSTWPALKTSYFQESCANDPVNITDPLGLSWLSWAFGFGRTGPEARAFDAEMADQYWSGRMGGRAISAANAEAKMVIGVGEAVLGAKATVESAGLATSAGYVMALDAASRTSGGATDYINLFTDKSVGNGDVVETGFKMALGNKYGSAGRDITSAILTAGGSTLASGAIVARQPLQTATTPRPAAVAVKPVTPVPAVATEGAVVPPIQQGQKMVDIAVREYLPNIRLAVPPTYDPSLPVNIFGQSAAEIRGLERIPVYSKVGPSSLAKGYGDVVDTILHEESHLRWPLKSEDDVRALTERFFRMKGWGYGD